MRFPSERGSRETTDCDERIRAYKIIGKKAN